MREEISQLQKKNIELQSNNEQKKKLRMLEKELFDMSQKNQKYEQRVQEL